MGLFNRDDKPLAETLYDTLALTGSENIDSEYFEPDELNPSFNPAMNAPTLRNNIHYGIEDAIELMRRLPKENSELVVSVVKETLESTNISIAEIIADADNKSTQIRNRNEVLEREISELRAQINEREGYIEELQSNLNETLSVREKLQLSVNQAPQPAQAAPSPMQQAVPTAAQQPQHPQPAQPTMQDASAVTPITTEAMPSSRREKRLGTEMPH